MGASVICQNLYKSKYKKESCRSCRSTQESQGIHRASAGRCELLQTNKNGRYSRMGLISYRKPTPTTGRQRGLGQLVLNQASKIKTHVDCKKNI